MKEKEMATNEVVGELTEQEIVAGAFNVVKKHIIEKLENQGEEESMLKILELNRDAFQEKFSGKFRHEVMEGDYTTSWRKIIERSDSIEEILMALHVVYQTMADIKAAMKDPIGSLSELLGERKSDPMESLMRMLLREKRGL